MAVEIKKVGFIGLGRMGTAIARKILSAGFELRVYNRTQSKMAPFIQVGAVGANSPKEAANGADVVITLLMDDRSVMDCVTGGDGLLAGMHPGEIHICLTTISPHGAAELARLHAANGTRYIAGPVVGRPEMVETRVLFTYVAGEKEAVDACKCLLDAYAGEVIYVGDKHEQANVMKLAYNYCVISVIELIGQVYAFGEKNGIDPAKLHVTIEKILNRPGLRNYAKKILAREFDDAGFEMSAGFKDVLLMLEASNQARAPLSYASVVREKLLTGLAHGMEHKDWAAIYEITRMNAGLH